MLGLIQPAVADELTFELSGIGIFDPSTGYGLFTLRWCQLASKTAFVVLGLWLTWAGGEALHLARHGRLIGQRLLRLEVTKFDGKRAPKTSVALRYALLAASPVAAVAFYAILPDVLRRFVPWETWTLLSTLVLPAWLAPATPLASMPWRGHSIADWLTGTRVELVPSSEHGGTGQTADIG